MIDVEVRTPDTVCNSVLRLDSQVNNSNHKNGGIYYYSQVDTERNIGSLSTVIDHKHAVSRSDRRPANCEL